MTKVAVLGGSGFIGKFLVPILRESNFEVLVGNSKNADVTNKIKLDKFIKNTDVIVHMAVYQNVFDKDYEKFKNINVNGTKNVLDIAKKYKIRVILFSSEVVFRNSTDFYSKSKKDQLELANKYKNVEIIYPPAVLNLNQKIPRWKLMPGGVMAAIGNGNKMVNFIDVKDLCRYVVVLIKSKKTSNIPIKTLSRKNYLKEINRKIGGLIVPFRLPVWVFKIGRQILTKTKYKMLMELIIENEK